jgi:hypothetical protein
LVRLTRSLSQALRRTCWRRLGTATRASLVLGEILLRYPNQRRRVPLWVATFRSGPWTIRASHASANAQYIDHTRTRSRGQTVYTWHRTTECGHENKVRHAHLTIDTPAHCGIGGTFHAAFVATYTLDPWDVHNAWTRLRLRLRSSRVVWSRTAGSRATLRRLRTVHCSVSPNRQPYAIFGSPCFFPGQHATYFPF